MPRLWSLSLLVLLLAARPAAAFDTAAKAAIMIDYASGDVLLAKDPDEARPPASLTKLMTLDLVFSRLKSGNLKLDDELPVSAKAWRTGGSKMFVKVGDRGEGRGPAAWHHRRFRATTPASSSPRPWPAARTPSPSA